MTDKFTQVVGKLFTILIWLALALMVVLTLDILFNESKLLVEILIWR